MSKGFHDQIAEKDIEIIRLKEHSFGLDIPWFPPCHCAELEQITCAKKGHTIPLSLGVREVASSNLVVPTKRKAFGSSEPGAFLMQEFIQP